MPYGSLASGKRILLSRLCFPSYPCAGMMSYPAQDELVPSVWDRLLACGREGADPMEDYGVPELLQAVQRDLEDLLNTWQTHEGLCEELPEVASSVIAFGIPDLPSQSTFTVAQRAALAQEITASIQKFEPRLRDARTTITAIGSAKLPTLSVSIEGQLRLGDLTTVPWKGAWRLGLNQRLLKAEES